MVCNMGHWIEKSFGFSIICFAYLFFYFFMQPMNFTKNGIPTPTKSSSFTGNGQGYMVQQPKKSFSLLTLFVVIVCTFFLAFLLFKNLDRITNIFSSSSLETTTGFTIGQDVSLSGTLQADGDLVSYTHTLVMADTTTVGLKSRTLNLWLYSGEVIVQWV